MDTKKIIESEIAKGRCWFFHDWTMWNQHSDQIKSLKNDGKWHDEFIHRQSRRCISCGLTQTVTV